MYQYLKERIYKIESIAKKRGWDIYVPLRIDSPATPQEIKKVEDSIGVSLPAEYKELMLNFSKKVEFEYAIEEEVPEEFEEIFSGNINWDLHQIADQFDMYQKWIEAAIDVQYNDERAVKITLQIKDNKLPLAEVASGDLLVVDTVTNEVQYFDHEGGNMHGKRLGKSLLDFLDRLSQIGLIGNDGEQFEELYDHVNKELLSIENPKVQRWINWFYN